MKKIYNWQYATVFDTEADGLLDEATKLHVLSCELQDGKVINIDGSEVSRVKKFLEYHIEKELPVVAHYGIFYDIPLLEKLLDINLSELMVIDTVALSWYLNVNRSTHGLDSFFEDYGIAKPKIDDWENLTQEEYQHRCREDVRINKALWEDFKDRLVNMYSMAKEAIDNGLVDGTRQSTDEFCFLDQYKLSSSVSDYIDRLLTFLMFKCDCARLQEITRFKADKEYLLETEADLFSKIEAAKIELEAVMPKVPEYSVKKKPKKPYKKNGDLSASGEDWNTIVRLLNKKDELGNTLVQKIDGSDDLKVLKGYKEPNINSTDQLKDWFFSLGWTPKTFKFVKDKEAQQVWVDSGFRKELKPKPRMIPQINKEGEDGKELCDSVVELAEEVPEIMAYSKYSLIKHRLDTIKGFIRDLSDDGYLKARIGGFTNTLRVKHRELVNLVGVDKPYGKEIRGSLTCEKHEVLLGTDLSSLEDRVKHHFMIPHDPDYVATMMEDDYDPHLKMCVVSGLITENEYLDYKNGKKDDHVKAARKKGKACLPVDNTEVLTINGWKKFQEICINDQVMSMNVETKDVEFCKVLDTVEYPSQEVTLMKGQSWEIESTPDHRWYTSHRTGRGITRRVEQKYQTTDKLKTSYNIVSAGVYVGGRSNVSVEDSRLLGWILADGSFSASTLTNRTSQTSNGTKQAVKMSVSQSELKHFTELEQAIEACGISYSKYLNNSGVWVFQFHQQHARDFLVRLGLPLLSKHEIDYTSFLLGLSKEALIAFFDSFWLADGNTAASGTKYKTKIIYQNGGNILDAIQLCSELIGKTTTKSLRKDSKDFYTLRCKNTGERGLQRVNFSYSRHTDVFCLTTENGNFFIRQGGVITLTGNCNYASVYNAGAETIARSAGVDLATGKMLFEGYWKLNWAVKKIAEEQHVFTCNKGLKWLVNPINGICYSLRKDSDRFSTLCQGTGSYFFDMWVDNTLTNMQQSFGVKRLCGSFHDEYITRFKDSEHNRKAMFDLVTKSINQVNDSYMLRRPLGCDIQFGKRYSDIH